MLSCVEDRLCVTVEEAAVATSLKGGGCIAGLGKEQHTTRSHVNSSSGQTAGNRGKISVCSNM